MSCLLTCDELNGMDWETILRSLIVLDDNGCFALRSTASGGGSYTFPANHGNVAYVATDGNDGTGAVGNISKPYQTAQAALSALDIANDGTIIILSSTSLQEIANVNYLDDDAPEKLTIHDMCSCGVGFTGSIEFNEIFVNTKGLISIATNPQFIIGSYCHLNGTAVTISDSCEGSILMLNGLIECDYFTIDDNGLLSAFLDVIKWKKGATIGTIDSFEYNDCTPWEYHALLNQVDTDPPTAVVLKNTLGETLTYGYVNTGEYSITSAGSKFVVGYTAVAFGAGRSDGGGLTTLGLTTANAIDEINFAVYSPFDFSYSNDELVNTPIDIKVYPEKY